MSNLTVSAYYYPGYHPTPETDNQVGPGWTEWEMVKAAKPHYPTHYQPRVPIWGYEDESDPVAMARKLKAAAEYGVDHFHFVWYWYDHGPFIGGALEKGYLSAIETVDDGPTFSILWANHDRFDGFPEETTGPGDLLNFTDYTRNSLDEIAEYWLEKYFPSEHYFRTARGELFLSIHYVSEFIGRAGGSHAVHAFIQRLRAEVKRRGLGPLHVNTTQGYFFEDPPLLHDLGFDSVTNYAAMGYTESFGSYDNPANSELHLPNYAGVRHRSGSGRLEHVVRTWTWTAEQTKLPYFPVVTVGRDCSPRVTGPASPEYVGRYGNRVILDDTTPRLFGLELEAAMQYMRSAEYSGAQPHLFINSWNEWTEGAYLEPDKRYHYEYLREVRECKDRWLTEPWPGRQ